MSDVLIGRAREGRRIASSATGAGTVKVVEIKAPIGDGTTADSATPFLKFTGTQDTSGNGSNNMSSANNFSDGSGTWFKLDVQPGFAIGGQQRLPTQAETIKRGYYKQEQAGWRSEHSKNKVKRAWGL